MYRRLLWVVCTVVLTSGCYLPPEYDPLIGLHYTGTANARVNQSDWNGHSYASKHPSIENKINFHIDSLSYKYSPIETLYFRKLPNKPGRYELNNASSHIDDGLVLCQFLIRESHSLLGSYNTMLGERTNYVEVIQYDTNTGKIDIEFEVTLVIFSRPPDELAKPDTLRFTNGRATAIIEEF